MDVIGEREISSTSLSVNPVLDHFYNTYMWEVD
jgi:hypothetical protein